MHFSQPIDRRKFLAGCGASAAMLLAAEKQTLAGNSEDPSSDPAVTRIPTKPQVLQLLNELSQTDDRRLLIGQDIGPSRDADDNWKLLVRPLKAVGERGATSIPLIQIDYGEDPSKLDEIRFANRLMIEHARQGGLVAVTMHPASIFFPNLGVREEGEPSVLERGEIGTAGLDCALDPSTSPGDRLQQVLRCVGDGLAELRSNGVPVLWSPFHQATGDKFWWSPRHPHRRRNPGSNAEDFIAIWKHIHHYLTEERKLDNLLWVYSAAAGGGWNDSPTSLYPGSDYVDVVAIDWYGDELTANQLASKSGYRDLTELPHPFAFSEIGALEDAGRWDTHRAVKTIQEHCPKAAYVMAKHSWNETSGRAHFAWVDNINGRELFNLPDLPTRKQIAEHWEK